MRPNRLDYLIYSIFRKRWNRIFAANRDLSIAYTVAMCLWIEKEWGVELLKPEFRQKKEKNE